MTNEKRSYGEWEIREANNVFRDEMGSRGGKKWLWEPFPWRGEKSFSATSTRFATWRCRWQTAGRRCHGCDFETITVMPTYQYEWRLHSFASLSIACMREPKDCMLIRLSNIYDVYGTSLPFDIEPNVAPAGKELSERKKNGNIRIA